ncbi:hypothetical protein CSIV_14400 [Microbacterium sp. CSI-V]|uniref:hypothetical protein n=1 Tax=Microbacterium sp. CSI-V TaxID=1933777 RepID=UPI00097C8852|nr:hypothetical protein [Microbacterium sp. CSI-V]ONI62662.1 hypothetical protein CSIV_14400 [Microbacterium sp. CSI-V]
MSAVAVVEPVVEERPRPVAPTPREVLARSRRIAEASVDLLDDEALRMERDRMALATVHSVLAEDGYARQFAQASHRAADNLACVVAMKAADRTHGFTRPVKP